MRRDLSQSHHRIGSLWYPREAPQPEPDTAPQPNLDDLDIAAYKARLERTYAAACQRLDDPTMSADSAQYTRGYKAGLAEALRFFDVAGRRPTVPPTAPDE